MRLFALAMVLGALFGAPSDAIAGPKFAAITADGLPNVQAASSVVIDLSTGMPLFEKNADEVRPIASTGKVMVALLVRRQGLDLDAITTISDGDQKLARGGARTRLFVGHGFRNVDLLRAMLIASDNRAPSALGRAVGLSPTALIYEMNVLAAELGLKNTKFDDCSGLRGNVSTARDMALLLGEVLKDPLLAEIMATKEATVRSIAKKPKRIAYRNTTRPLHSEKHDILGGKTGYTDAAKYCLIIAARHSERPLAMAFLGAEGKMTRFGDFGRVMKWLESKAPRAPAPAPQ